MLERLLLVLTLSIPLMAPLIQSRPSGNLERRASPHQGQTQLGLKNVAGLYGWLANITVGTEEIEVYVDTGSSRLVLSQDVYHPSPSAIDLHHTIVHKYADGSGGSLDMYLDDLTLGSLHLEKVALGHYRGQQNTLMGLSRSGKSFNKSEPSLLESLVAQQLLPTGIFTLELRDDGGSLVFNDADTEGYTWHPVNDTAYKGGWIIDTQASFGRKKSTWIDSGSSEIYLTYDDFKAFAGHFGLTIAPYPGYPKEVRVVGDCNREVHLVFEFSQGQKIKVPKRRFWQDYKNNEGLCYSNVFAERDDNWGNIWTLGMVFMEVVKVAHDVHGSRLGFRSRQ